MVVVRSMEQVYNLSPGVVTEQVESVIRSSTAYKLVRKSRIADETQVIARVNSRIPLTLSTDFIIEVRPTQDKTVVRMTTRSQPWIMGDIFGMYDRYLTNFAGQLQNFLSVTPISQTTPATPRSVSPWANWSWFAYLLILLISIVAYLTFIHPLSFDRPYLGLTLPSFIPLLILAFVIIAVANALRIRPR